MLMFGPDSTALAGKLQLSSVAARPKWEPGSMGKYPTLSKSDLVGGDLNNWVAVKDGGVKEAGDNVHLVIHYVFTGVKP